MLIANDPYLTGTHISDTSRLRAGLPRRRARGVRRRDRALGRHRRQDARRLVPGLDDVYQEGLCFTHQRLVDAGKSERRICWTSSTRTSASRPTVRGDLDAQIAACRSRARPGVARCARSTAPTPCARRCASTIEQTDAAVRRADRQSSPTARTPPSIEMDHDGVVKDEHPRVAADADRRRATASASRFDGTSRPRPAALINMTAIGTAGSVRAAVKALAQPTRPDERGPLPRARLRPAAGADRVAPSGPRRATRTDSCGVRLRR